MHALKLLGQQLSKIWQQLGINQRIVIIVSGLAVGGLMAALVFWSSRPSYSLLFPRLDVAEAGKIAQELEEMKVKYHTGAGGSSIYVEQAQVYKVRMQLAAKGLPKTEGVGFEIFDKPAFGMSDFVQKANYLRAVQGELARTIREIDGVEAARVMIVQPESRLLIDPQKKHKASVFLKLRGTKQIDSSAVNAIRFLVANSVEGLKPQDVVVADNAGNMLSENDEEGSLSALGGTQLAMRRNVEKYLAGKVKNMLEAFLGPDQAVVTVSAEINNETITKTDEYYDPKNKVERTETVRDESTESVTPQPGGVPGTTVNANVDTNAPPFATVNNQTKKKDTQTEYAVSMSKTNIVRVAGGLSRVTASVFVNTNANPVFTNATADVSVTLTNLQAAVANALGQEMDPTLGEIPNVKLYGVAFNKQHEVELTEKLDKEQRSEFFLKIGRTSLFVLLGVAALFGFWRLVKNSSEELLPTGIPVGQLVGGQLVYETPTAMAGMAFPSAAVQAAAEQQVQEIMPEEPEVEELQAAKSKLVMDFGLGQQAPERITIEVLKQLIRENPAKMSQAARNWLSRKMQEGDET